MVEPGCNPKVGEWFTLASEVGGGGRIRRETRESSLE